MHRFNAAPALGLALLLALGVPFVVGLVSLFL